MFLLDVNLLIALAWDNHVFHSAATKWYSRSGKNGFYTCALTQLGFLRISTNAAFSTAPASMSAALNLLGAITALSAHRYLEQPERVFSALKSRVDFKSHKQVTDLFLVELSRLHGAKLATLDRRLFESQADRSGIELVSVPRP